MSATPVVLIHGGNCTRASAQIRPGRIVEVECGHMAMYDRPAALAAALNAWAFMPRRRRPEGRDDL